MIRYLLVTYNIIGVDRLDCQRALDLQINDFEDAIAAVCAKKANADYIITNDKEFLAEQDLDVPAISPGDFLEKLNNK